jgi:hypothetical protein
MARLRTIKPEFWVSEQVAECSASARLTFIGIWNFCDDGGVHPAKPRTLKAEIYPMDDFTVGQVEGWVNELLRAGLLAPFSSEDGGEYWHVTGWERHQKIDRPTFKHPSPPQVSATPRRAIAEDSARPRDGVETNGVETNGVESSGEAVAVAAATTRTHKVPTKSALPAGFTVSDQVKAWATGKGFEHLAEHLEAFKTKALAKGYAYADWDAAFMEAIRKDWAGVRSTQDARQGPKSAHSSTISSVLAPTPQWAIAAGFKNQFEAENAGCTERNHKQFSNGQKRRAA